jgi:hypothetical protein
VAITHIAVLGAALVVLLCLPCALAVITRGDRLAIRRAWVRQGQQHAAALRLLDRQLGSDRQSGFGLMPPVPMPRAALGVEQIAAEIRRLDRLRHSEATACSQLWRADIERAYDCRLRMASECLGVAEHLINLTGVDLDLERLRVVSELESAGLAVRQRS